MKLINAKLVLILILAGALGSGPVLAAGGHGHSGGARSGGHVRLGVFIGGAAFWPGFYYSPYYSGYYPPYYSYPPEYVTPAPTQYIEAPVAQPAPQAASSYWYYCAGTKAYYPYVKQCPGGWQRVAPQPPPG
jgi:hypothetical protein